MKAHVFRSVIHKKFRNIKKKKKKLIQLGLPRAHLQLPRETQTIQTETVLFCEMGENNELRSQVLMMAVLADNGEKS